MTSTRPLRMMTKFAAPRCKLELFSFLCSSLYKLMYGMSRRGRLPPPATSPRGRKWEVMHGRHLPQAQGLP